MPDFMQTASTWLAAQQKANLSQSVTYLRGSRAVGSSLTATIGRTERQMDQTGVLRWVYQDFIFTAADLTLDGSVITPDDKSDEITWSGRTYKVLGDGGLPESTPSDGYRVQIRVRTKQVD